MNKIYSVQARAILDQWETDHASSRGACINIFPSSEITGGYYRTGRRVLPQKREKIVSEQFTRQARKTIRRAVECGATSFKFVTLTFDPKIAEVDDTGRVIERRDAGKLIFAEAFPGASEEEKAYFAKLVGWQYASRGTSSLAPISRSGMRTGSAKSTRSATSTKWPYAGITGTQSRTAEGIPS